METIPVMVTDIPRRNSIQRRRGVRAIWFACSLSAFLLLSTITSAQVKRQNPVTGPELARHNLAQVGASAEDIKVVLVKSPGLMVEVKRWVAKDATKARSSPSATWPMTRFSNACRTMFASAP